MQSVIAEPFSQRDSTAGVAVEVEHLLKLYGAIRAVDDISFVVPTGTIFGLLGPNGAGKTTTTEIIAGLRQPDSGSVRILGRDIQRDAAAIKQQIGVQLQTTALYQKLTVREIIALFGSFFIRALPPDDVIAMVDLQEKATTRSKVLSGGQRQRLAVAIALVNDPELIFLDEPTTGLDPQARHRMWELIESLRRRGRSIFLTTHSMEEAERLCDAVAIMDHGKIIASGAPRALVQQYFPYTTIEFVMPANASSERFHDLPQVVETHDDNGTLMLYSADAPQTIAALTQLTLERDYSLSGLSVRQSTLEDVFLHLTGRRIRE